MKGLPASIAVIALLAAPSAPGQAFDQRGFVETQALAFPQDGSNDSGHAVDSMLLRWEPSYKASSWFTLEAAFDARADSHQDTARTAHVDFDDREILRPSLSVRRLSGILHRGHWTAEIGRQFIRWGKTDILNPTDRFAPKDFIAGMLKAIIGFELPIARVEGKWKMSQNRREPDRQGVIAGLEAEADPQSVAVAAIMAARERK